MSEMRYVVASKRTLIAKTKHPPHKIYCIIFLNRTVWEGINHQSQFILVVQFHLAWQHWNSFIITIHFLLHWQFTTMDIPCRFKRQNSKIPLLHLNSHIFLVQSCEANTSIYRCTFTGATKIRGVQNMYWMTSVIHLKCTLFTSIANIVRSKRRLRIRMDWLCWVSPILKSVVKFSERAECTLDGLRMQFYGIMNAISSDRLRT